MLVSQGNPEGVELFSYVNTFVGFMLHSLRTEIQANEVQLRDINSAESSVGFGYTTRSQTTTFCSYETSYTIQEDTSAKFLNAINTSF